MFMISVKGQHAVQCTKKDLFLYDDSSGISHWPFQNSVVSKYHLRQSYLKKILACLFTCLFSYSITIISQPLPDEIEEVGFKKEMWQGMPGGVMCTIRSLINYFLDACSNCRYQASARNKFNCIAEEYLPLCLLANSFVRRSEGVGSLMCIGSRPRLLV